MGDVTRLRSPFDSAHRSHSHDNEYSADDDTLHAATEDGVRDDGEGFIDNHVREK
jgi:hypothetical protein